MKRIASVIFIAVVLTFAVTFQQVFAQSGSIDAALQGVESSVQRRDIRTSLIANRFRKSQTLVVGTYVIDVSNAERISRDDNYGLRFFITARDNGSITFRDYLELWNEVPYKTVSGYENIIVDGDTLVVATTSENPIAAVNNHIIHAVIAASQKRLTLPATPGTVSVFFADPSDNRVRSVSNVSWTAAQDCLTICDTPDPATNTTAQIGNGVSAGTYTLNQYFANFDTSAIPDLDSVDSVDFTIYNTANSNGSEDQWTLEVRLYDFGTSVTSGDWIPLATATNWTSLSLLAYTGKPTGVHPDADPIEFATTGAFVSSINKTGNTSIAMLINYEYDENAITFASERVVFYTGDAADPPTLTVTHCFMLPCTSPTPTPTPNPTEITLVPPIDFTPFVLIGALAFGFALSATGLWIKTAYGGALILLGGFLMFSASIPLGYWWLDITTGMLFVAIIALTARSIRNRNNPESED